MQREIKSVTIHAEGRAFEGYYAVQSDMLTVWHSNLGSRTARVPGSSLEQQVRALLLEIFVDCRNRRMPYATSRR